MKTKLISCLLALLMIFAFSTGVMADSLQNGDQVYIGDGIGDVGGGIFIVKDITYQPLFESFCLEQNENLQNAPFTVNIDTYVVGGGLGGVEEISPGVYGDPISIATAYLYFSFRNDSIPGFDKTSIDDVDALQFAFWVLENEWPEGAVPALYATRAAEFIDFAESSDWNNIRNVRVLNLSSESTIPGLNEIIVQRQSMLTLVPEPMSLLLLGLGLLGIGITRKRFAK